MVAPGHANGTGDVYGLIPLSPASEGPGTGELRDLLDRLQLPAHSDAADDEVSPMELAASVRELLGCLSFDAPLDLPGADAGAAPPAPAATASADVTPLDSTPTASGGLSPLMPHSGTPDADDALKMCRAPPTHSWGHAPHPQPQPQRPARADAGGDTVHIAHTKVLPAHDLRDAVRGLPPPGLLVVAPVLMEATAFAARLDAAGLTALAYGTMPGEDAAIVTSAVCSRTSARDTLRESDVFATSCAALVRYPGGLVRVTAVYVPRNFSAEAAVSVAQWVAGAARASATRVVVGWVGAPHAPRVEQVLGAAGLQGAHPAGEVERRVYTQRGACVEARDFGGAGSGVGCVEVKLGVAVEPLAEPGGDYTRPQRTMRRSCKVIRLERALFSRFVARQELREAGDAQEVAAMNREISDIRRKLEHLKEQDMSHTRAKRCDSDRPRRPQKPYADAQ